MARYPQNPVLRLLTPKDTCRKLSVYPVRLTQDAIEVDISSQVGPALFWGGASCYSFTCHAQANHTHSQADAQPATGALQRGTSCLLL